MRPTTGTRLLASLGALSVLLGLTVLLVARWSLGRSVYVSEMGAEGMPTETAFSVALMLVAVGGAAVAVAGRRVRARLLPLLPPSAGILLASACFAFASQVTCTRGCPLPVGDSFTWQDLLHTSAAVLGFAAACVAMLQLSTAPGRTGVARFSLWSGVLVAVIAGAGAILSLLRFGMGVGGTLEFVATAVAIVWLAGYGLLLAAGSDAGPTAARTTEGGYAAARTPR